MIRAVFHRKNGRLCGFSVTGHAGYADAGQDIVCAAVSSAVQLTTILVTETYGEAAEESAKDNLVRFRLTAPAVGQGASLLEGFRQHLQFLSEDYPGTIQIEISEV